jgi:hypothetical protein
MVSVETLFNIAYKKYVLGVFAPADLKFESENVGHIYSRHIFMLMISLKNYISIRNIPFIWFHLSRCAETVLRVRKRGAGGELQASLLFLACCLFPCCCRYCWRLFCCWHPFCCWNCIWGIAVAVILFFFWYCSGQSCCFAGVLTLSVMRFLELLLASLHLHVLLLF